VRKISVMHMVKRLSDYHFKFPHGKENEMQVHGVKDNVLLLDIQPS